MKLFNTAAAVILGAGMAFCAVPTAGAAGSEITKQYNPEAYNAGCTGPDIIGCEGLEEGWVWTFRCLDNYGKPLHYGQCTAADDEPTPAVPLKHCLTGPSDHEYVVVQVDQECPAGSRDYPQNAPVDAPTFNCWGRDMLVGKVCPVIPPFQTHWLPCPNISGQVYTLDGDCRPSP